MSGIAARCVPGTTFMLGCNKCLCRQSGRGAFCTKKDCRKQLSDVCVPGRVTTMECNRCICTTAGRWACTDKECYRGVKYEDCATGIMRAGQVEKPHQKCIPGTSFRIRCERCYCSQDGVSAVCSRPPCNGIKGVVVQLNESYWTEGDCGGGGRCGDGDISLNAAGNGGGAAGGAGGGVGGGVGGGFGGGFVSC
ncbi:pacifastin-like protease inhibitor cvp4 [Schistocerca americana]|uniref:pacifastin-like protease inhibitor cvp4 n=1 Tax=Schistocerca americana TaxID=7009 RepID=UPI001F503DA2|nr:pacifastin-like protease inhibitor cvp4 [Schistocerca americana]